MSNDSTYLVDPYLLQTPSPGEWLATVDSILSWTAYDSRDTRQFILSFACVSSLMEPGNCPYVNRSELHRMLKSEGELSIAAPDLHRQVNKLLTDAEYSQAAALTQRLELKPQVVVTRQCAQQIKDAFPCCLIALHLAQTPGTADGFPPIASRPGDGLYDETDVQISARVLYAEGIQQEKLSFPLDVSSGSVLLFKPPAVPLDPTTLIADPVSTLKKAYDSQVCQADKAVYPLRDFSVNSDFVLSICNLHLDNDLELLGIIIKTAVRILSGQERRFPSMAIHPHNVGPRSGDRQLIRPDGAAAFRAHLTKHGPGYRLIYWRKGSTYELWQVCTESG